MNAEGSGNAALLTGGSSHKSKPVGTPRYFAHRIAFFGRPALLSARFEIFNQSRGRLSS